MWNLKLNYNTLFVTKNEPEFPVKGSETTLRDSCEKTKCLEKRITKKILGKTLDRYVNKDQNQFPKDFLFFIFSNTLKTNKK